MRYAAAVTVVALGLLGCEHYHDEGNVAWDPFPDGSSSVDGQSCDGSYVCPWGQIPVLEGPVGADSCVCRWSCAAPDGACPSADRVCIQLEDDNGAPLPGEGACEPVYVAGRGEPCGPQQCDVGDICAGYSPDTAYCRAQCDPDLQDCGVGYECILVAEYGDPTATACLPVTGDVAAGGACGLEAPCQEGLFCVTTAAGSTCQPACDPWAPVCAAGSTCLRLTDPVMQTLGYACVPGA
jgi:hypothetical protein